LLVTYLVGLVNGTLAIQDSRADGRGRDNQLRVFPQSALLLHRRGAAVVELSRWWDGKTNPN